MGVPKRRRSASKNRMRRANQSIGAPATVACPECHEPKMPHRICPKCGFYNKKEVLKVE